MGRGIAKQVKDMFPDIDLAFGENIRCLGLEGKKYGIICCTKYPNISAFQVKYHWADEADLDLIAVSVATLIVEAEINLKCDPDWTAFLNFPGIGNGRLKREDVLPLVEKLPDCITVWEF